MFICRTSTICFVGDLLLLSPFPVSVCVCLLTILQDLINVSADASL